MTSTCATPTAARSGRACCANQLGHAPDGVAELSPTGWLRVRDATGETRVDAAQTTEYQLAFRAAVDAVRNHAWGAHEPYFERLEIRVDLPGIDFALPVDEEIVSTTRRCTRTCTSRCWNTSSSIPAARPATAACSPGRSFPTCRHDAARVRISVEAFTPISAVTPALPGFRWRRRASAVGGADRRLHGGPGRRHVPGHLAPGQAGAGHLPARPRSRRLHFRRPARQRNLRRGRCARAALAASGKGHFALIAAENPDGYALFARLREQHPRHMLHASRSALGDDIAYRERAPFFERDGRHQAHAISGAQLHINLHGYPAHEWTRPMSGYLPRHFELWTIPKGFFLVLRHHPGWGERARRLIEGVTARLARNVPGLVEFNARQMELFRAHALETGFAVMNGIPVQVTETDREELPMALISEFPDETVYGDRYVFAHTVQMETVLAATDIYRSGL